MDTPDSRTCYHRFQPVAKLKSTAPDMEQCTLCGMVVTSLGAAWMGYSEHDRNIYADADGRHTAFEAEFKAICDRYRVQASVFYAGFDNVVGSVSRCYSRQQLATILHAACTDLIPKMLAAIATVTSGRQGNIYVHYEDSA